MPNCLSLGHSLNLVAQASADCCPAAVEFFALLVMINKRVHDSYTNVKIALRMLSSVDGQRLQRGAYIFEAETDQEQTPYIDVS